MKSKALVKVMSVSVLFSILVVFPILIVCAQPAQAAEAFPSKSIQFFIGGTPGDAYDTNGRKFAPTLAKKLGVDVLPANLLGPMSVHFWDQIYGAKPDGHTVGFIGAADRPYLMFMGDRLKYDVTEIPVVCAINTFPDLVWASAKSKLNIRTAEQLLNYKGPIRVNLFSSILVGVCSLAIVAQERNLDLRPVVYAGFSEGHVAMLRGDVDIGTTTASGTPLKFIQAGHYIPLFVWGAKRFEKLPDTPCSRELKLNPDLEGTMQQRIFVTTPGTPPDRIAKLAEAVKATLTDPEIVEWGKTANQPLFYMSTQDYVENEGKVLALYRKYMSAIKPFLK